MFYSYSIVHSSREPCHLYFEKNAGLIFFSTCRSNFCHFGQETTVMFQVYFENQIP